jgi:hypothetical protein
MSQEDAVVLFQKSISETPAENKNNKDPEQAPINDKPII